MLSPAITFSELAVDVKLNSDLGNIQADKVDYDFNTKYFKVSMFDDKGFIKEKDASHFETDYSSEYIVTDL